MRLLVLLGLLAGLAATLRTGDALGSDSIVHASIDLDGRSGGTSRQAGGASRGPNAFASLGEDAGAEAAAVLNVQGDFAGIATCVNSCKALCTSTRAKCLMKAYSYGRGPSIQQLWWGAPLDKYPGYDGPLPSMLSEGDCIAHILLGASVGDPGADVALVEMGTWLGAASVCTAAGLSLARSTVEYHAFDLFSMPPSKHRENTNFHKLHVARDVPPVKALIESPDHRYEAMWNEIVTQVYPSKRVHSHAGFIGSTGVGGASADWNDKKVGLFMIDSAKDYHQLVLQSHAVWNKLRPGSVVLFSDFLMPLKSCSNAVRANFSQIQSVPGFVYRSLVEKGLFKLLWVFPKSQQVAFEVTDKYQPSRAQEYLTRCTYPKQKCPPKPDWAARFHGEIKGNLRDRRYSTGFFMKQMNRTKNIFKCDQ